MQNYTFMQQMLSLCRMNVNLTTSYKQETNLLRSTCSNVTLPKFTFMRQSNSICRKKVGLCLVRKDVVKYTFMQQMLLLCHIKVNMIFVRQSNNLCCIKVMQNNTFCGKCCYFVA